MKKYTNYMTLLFIGIAFLSCSSNAGYKDDFTENNAKVESYAAEELDQSTDGGLEEEIPSGEDLKEPVMLIRHGQISFETTDMFHTISRMRSLNRQFNNTLFSENQYENQYSRTASFSIGVHPKKFDEYLDSLDQIAVTYISKTISGDDVTDEVVDIRSRINTKKAVLARYLELLNQAKGIDEILRMEREVGQIQEEIEATEARYKSIMHRVNLSKLEISISQELKPIEEDTFKTDAEEAVDGGTDSVKKVIVGALYIWPFWILSLIAIIWLLIKRKQWRKKK